MTGRIRGIEKSAELENLFTFLQKVFIKTPLDYFKKRINNDPWLILNDIRIAEENNEIVSSVSVFRRKMHWRGKPVNFAGIGNVSTLPDKRGRGLSSEVMKNAIKYIKENSISTAILFTGINSFYELFDFFTISAYYLTFHIKDQKEKTRYSIRNFIETDLEKVSTIYDAFNKKLYGPIDRNIDYWKANLKFAEENEIFLVAECNQQIEGYMRIVPSKERNEIWEFGYSNIEAMNALICEAGIILNKREIKTFALCPKNIVEESKAFKVSCEPSTIAMAFVTPDEFTTDMKEGFNNYCFWWTDNF